MTDPVGLKGLSLDVIDVIIKCFSWLRQSLSGKTKQRLRSDMIHNPVYYASHIEQLEVSQVRVLEQAFFEKVLPGFDNIEAESDAVTESEEVRLGSMPATNEVNPADLAKDAQLAGLAYYEAMIAARQTMLNTMAQTLYHLFEQQIIAFYRHHLLDPKEEFTNTFTQKEAIKQIKESLGVDCKRLNRYSKIMELRLVANTVKHAEGGASSQLQKIRPEMFINPCIRGDPITLSSWKNPTYMPCAGQDFFVTTNDLRDYFDAVYGFWKQMADQFWNQFADQLKSARPG